MFSANKEVLDLILELDDFMVGRFCISGPQKVCSSIGH
jgi:hypothetical protein